MPPIPFLLNLAKCFLKVLSSCSYDHTPCLYNVFQGVLLYIFKLTYIIYIFINNIYNIYTYAIYGFYRHICCIFTDNLCILIYIYTLLVCLSVCILKLQNGWTDRTLNFWGNSHDPRKDLCLVGVEHFYPPKNVKTFCCWILINSNRENLEQIIMATAIFRVYS